MEGMEISYLGHSCFKLKCKSGTVVCDPYGKSVGFSMPMVSADIVTVSHRGHGDHDEVGAVGGTARRKQPFVIEEPGEYEVEGVSVFGYQTFHDDKGGEERGSNTIYVFQAEDLRILHLGDLGHMLDERLIDELDGVDALMIPVGGVYTIGPKQALELAAKIEPTYVLPMHYKTDRHKGEGFGELLGVEEFVKIFGKDASKVGSLSLSKAGLPTDATEVVLFE